MLLKMTPHLEAKAQQMGDPCRYDTPGYMYWWEAKKYADKVGASTIGKIQQQVPVPILY